MKNFIKALVLLICISLLPAFPAAASEGVQVQEGYSDFLSYLGITALSDTSDMGREVSRAEFATMAVKMLAADTIGSSEGGFSDVSADSIYAPYICTAVYRGLLKGVSEGSFMPDSPITYGAAVKILVAALGYEEYAYLNGGYPAGYIVQANSVGIVKGVKHFDANAPIDMGSAIRMVANAIRCDLRKIVKVSADMVESEVIKGANCLTEYFGLKSVSGIVMTAGYHSAIAGYKSEEAKFEVSGKVLSLQKEGAEKYLGHQVQVWFDEDDNFCTVLPSAANLKIKLPAEDVWGYSNFEISADSGDGVTETKYQLDRGFSFVLNGKLINPAEADFLSPDGEVTLLDHNSDGKYDTVLATHYIYAVVKSVNTQTKTVYDRERNDLNLVLKNEDGYHCTIIKDGRETDYSFLEKNDVLKVAQSKDGLLCHVTVCGESVKGKITQFADDEIYIDDVRYETNSYFENYSAAQLSQSGVFLLDEQGRVTYLTGLYADMVDYGYLLDFGVIPGSMSSNSTVYIKLLTMDGEVIERSLTNKVILNGGTPIDKTDISISNALTNDNGNIPDYQLIRYGTDKEGNVRLIDTSAPLADNSNLVEKYSGSASAENSLTKYVDASLTYSYWREQAKAFIPFYALGSTIILEAPEELYNADATARYDDTAFSIISSGSLNAGKSGPLRVDAYDYDESMTPAIIIVYQGKAQAGQAVLKNPTDGDALDTHLVEKVVSCVTEDGEDTDRIYTYSAGEFTYFDVDPEFCSIIDAKNKVKPGDMVRFYISGGKICGLSVDARYDAANKKMAIDYDGGVIGDLISDSVTYVSGKVFSLVDLYSLVLKADNYPTYKSQEDNAAAQEKNNPERLDGLCALKAKSTTTVAVFDTKTGIIEHGTLSEIADIRSIGESGASYVCIRLGTYIPEFIVIYR